MNKNQISIADMQNPMFLHPSDRHNSINVEKLTGAADYRGWKRTMEISLASKRKLGFVTGVIKRPVNDAVEEDQWDTCNSMVIYWLPSFVSESIKKSVLFIDSAHEIWIQLEKRFAMSNGSRKYRINKDVYGLKQNGMSINEYYTSMKSLWEELDSMNQLPKITDITTEISEFLKALNKLKEENRLFQFLNGLDGGNGPQRSQLLLLNPFPIVGAPVPCYNRNNLKERF